MTLPTHQDLQTLRTADDMIAFALRYLEAGGANAVDDDAFYSRKGTNRIIKVLVEEYVPLALYLKRRDGQNLLGGLAPAGAQHDGEIHDQMGCIETVQIVHGTESESEALKREALRRGEPILKNATYHRSHDTNLPEIHSSIDQPRQAAEVTARNVIERIDNKAAKRYHQIDTLLVYYEEGMSTPYTQPKVIIYEQVLAWLQNKPIADLAPFRKLILISDKEDVRIFDLNVICP